MAAASRKPKPTPKAKSSGIAATLRRAAMRLPEAEEGVACAGTALESVTVKSRGKAFLFLGQGVARLKLGPSLAEATKLAKKDPERVTVGAKGWVKVALAGGAPVATLEKWVAESHAEVCG